MSPLWRDEIRVWLAPGELGLRRMRRGIRPACVADAMHAIESTADWRPALTTLDVCLGAATWRDTAARIVVSNRLARYAIVPWTDTLTYEAEHLAHARICLSDNYGNTGPDWRVCMSDAAPGDARVACALPQELLGELRTVLDTHGVPTLSVQPALIDAYNRCRHLLPQSACWFVNIEPGALVAARLSPKGWDNVYSARIGTDWQTELLRLRMLAKLAAQNPSDARVYVDAPERLRRDSARDDPGIEWLTTTDEAPTEAPEHRQSLSLRT